MNFLWSLFMPRARPAKVRPAEPEKDADLTRHAVTLLRTIGCVALAGRVAVRWHKRLTSTAGLAKPGNALILLNPRLKEFSDEVERTLRHELAHLVAYERANRRRITAHGPEWKRACADLGIPGESRCHALPLPRRQVIRRHAYRCPGCDFVLRRVRPIPSRRRLACQECCKRYANGRFDRRFEFIKVRADAAGRPPRIESMAQQTLNF